MDDEPEGVIMNSEVGIRNSELPPPTRVEISDFGFSVFLPWIASGGNSKLKTQNSKLGIWGCTVMSAKPPPPPPPTTDGAAPAVVATVKPLKKKRVLTGLKCGSCGGSVDVQEGFTNVTCRYCGTPQALVGNRGIVRLMVLNKLERKDASDVVRRWFRRGIRKDPALKKEARYQEAFLAWFPFVRARLDAVGWVLGIREKKRKRGNRWETVKEPVERQVERAVDLTMPAADMAEFGVHRVDLTGDEIQPLDDDLLRSDAASRAQSRAKEGRHGPRPQAALLRPPNNQGLKHGRERIH